AEAKASEFCFRQCEICSRSRVPVAKISTQHEAKFAACSPATEMYTSCCEVLCVAFGLLF
ncbi:MAG: hypothetical protein ABMA02_09270, partial [Saprospiraceae bacterium]